MRPEKTSAQHNIILTNVVEKLVLIVFNLHFWVAKEKQSGDFDPATRFYIIYGSCNA